jgi:hypothetical protein
VTDLFPTHFVDDIINEIVGHEFYSFTDNLLGYNQVLISKEDHPNTTFISELSSFAYRVMPFGIKNAQKVFSRIVVKEFQEYIYIKLWLSTLMTI